MTKLACLLALTLACSLTAYAQSVLDFPDEPRWQAVCAQAVKQPLPASAAAMAHAAVKPSANPSAKPPATPSATAPITDPIDGCDEEAAYYGIGRSPDYAAALRCGYLQRRFPDQWLGDPLQGPGVLSMLYANSYGVPRDYALAIRFVCENTWAAEAEQEGRVGRLEAMRDGKLPANKPFDLCDDATSGLMGGACALIDKRQADVKLAQRLAAAKTRLPAKAQAMLPALQAAEAAFEKVRLENELGCGGCSMTDYYALSDDEKLQEQFVINLERFARSDVPKASAAERVKTTDVLARAFAEVEVPPADPSTSEIQPKGEAATEQAWQRLFAAWLRFVPIAYPGLSADAVAVELERLRIHQLRKLSPAQD